MFPQLIGSRLRFREFATKNYIPSDGVVDIYYGVSHELEEKSSGEFHTDVVDDSEKEPLNEIGSPNEKELWLYSYGSDGAITFTTKKIRNYFTTRSSGEQFDNMDYMIRSRQKKRRVPLCRGGKRK